MLALRNGRKGPIGCAAGGGQEHASTLIA